MDNVTGESQDVNHEGEVVVLSWSWGMNSGDLRGGRTGGGYGVGTTEPLRLVKLVDKSSITLMGFVQTGKVTESALLTVRKAGQTPLEYLTIEMKSVRVTSLKVDSEGSQLVERVDLSFSEVNVSYRPQAQDGSGGPASSLLWKLDHLE